MVPGGGWYQEAVRVTTKAWEKTKRQLEDTQADLTRENSWERATGLGVKDADPVLIKSFTASINDKIMSIKLRNKQSATLT